MISWFGEGSARQEEHMTVLENILGKAWRDGYWSGLRRGVGTAETVVAFCASIGEKLEAERKRLCLD